MAFSCTCGASAWWHLHCRGFERTPLSKGNAHARRAKLELYKEWYAPAIPTGGDCLHRWLIEYNPLYLLRRCSRTRRSRRHLLRTDPIQSRPTRRVLCCRSLHLGAHWRHSTAQTHPLAQTRGHARPAHHPVSGRSHLAYRNLRLPRQHRCRRIARLVRFLRCQAAGTRLGAPVCAISRSARVAATLGAFGLATLPYLFHRVSPDTLSIVNLLLALHNRRCRPVGLASMSPAWSPLDAWGRTVLNRAVTAAWISWATARPWTPRLLVSRRQAHLRPHPHRRCLARHPSHRARIESLGCGHEHPRRHRMASAWLPFHRIADDGRGVPAPRLSPTDQGTTRLRANSTYTLSHAW